MQKARERGTQVPGQPRARDCSQEARSRTLVFVTVTPPATRPTEPRDKFSFYAHLKFPPQRSRRLTGSPTRLSQLFSHRPVIVEPLAGLEPVQPSHYQDSTLSRVHSPCVDRINTPPPPPQESSRTVRGELEGRHGWVQVGDSFRDHPVSASPNAEILGCTAKPCSSYRAQCWALKEGQRTLWNPHLLLRSVRGKATGFRMMVLAATE